MERLMTTKEVMEYMQIPRTTLYYLMYKKQLPVIKIGRRMLRFKREDIDEWINKHRKIT